MRLDNTQERNKLGPAHQRPQRDHGANQRDPVLNLLANELEPAGFLQITSNQDEDWIHLVESENQAGQPFLVSYAQDSNRKNVNVDISYSKFFAEG